MNDIQREFSARVDRIHAEKLISSGSEVCLFTANVIVRIEYLRASFTGDDDAIDKIDCCLDSLLRMHAAASILREGGTVEIAAKFL